jgi:hypothetical protein
VNGCDPSRKSCAVFHGLTTGNLTVLRVLIGAGAAATSDTALPMNGGAVAGGSFISLMEAEAGTADARSAFALARHRRGSFDSMTSTSGSGSFGGRNTA